MSKAETRNQRLAGLHYYSQGYDELYHAALGQELTTKLASFVPAVYTDELRCALAELFFRGKNLGYAEGRQSAERIADGEIQQIAEEKARARVAWVLDNWDNLSTED